jgi:hypothetical protein
MIGKTNYRVKLEVENDTGHFGVLELVLDKSDSKIFSRTESFRTICSLEHPAKAGIHILGTTSWRMMSLRRIRIK